MQHKIGDLVSFQNERFFEGAVQLRWTVERPDQADYAARTFVFHGPGYHGAGTAEEEGFDTGYKLKDSASFVSELVDSIAAGRVGRDVNPFMLVVAGYGYGKSHLALTTATLLSHPHSDTAAEVVTNIEASDATIGGKLKTNLTAIGKPALVLSLDGMAGFNLGNALSQAVFQQLNLHGVDTGAVMALSPRFETAAQFVDRNFSFRADQFSTRMPGRSCDAIIKSLHDHDEEVYAEVDAIYLQANGAPIPVSGQESAQDLLNTLSEVYCAPDGPFACVIILFDEFGRYLEYAAEKPHLAGDSALQQIFQGVQDNAARIRFVGFIQYELKAYLKRFGSVDLRQLQRYITRFDSAQKWYLSTNLETLFAHMIGKRRDLLEDVINRTGARSKWSRTWDQMNAALPAFGRLSAWNNQERFNKVIGEGCWPLHPLATWFLTRQTDIVQSRSALTFIKETIERNRTLDAISDGRLKQIGVSDLVLTGLLPEMVAAERETGSAVAETLNMLLEKYAAHLGSDHRAVLASIAVLEKMRVARLQQSVMDDLVGEASVMEPSALTQAISFLSQELGAIEWNRDLGQYELISDGSTRGQFQQWLRKQEVKLNPSVIKDLFLRRAGAETELINVSGDFALAHKISTQDWVFEAQFAHVGNIETVIKRSFQEWRKATGPTEPKGKIIYLFVHAEDAECESSVRQLLASELEQHKLSSAPIWVAVLNDKRSALAEHIGRLYVFDEQISSEEAERYRRFISEEKQRSIQALNLAIQSALKERNYLVAGITDLPDARIKKVADAIFEAIYPATVPFNFDGFTTVSGGGPMDCAQLTRSLIGRQVDGPWVRTLAKRLQNRVTSILTSDLKEGWGALGDKGELGEPTNPQVKAVYDVIAELHANDPKRTLLTTYNALVAPPIGMNSASAGLMLGLLIGLQHPPRRLQRSGQMVTPSEWLETGFPANKGRHALDEAAMRVTTLQFLSEDSVTRWKNLLGRALQETSFTEIIKLAHEAEQMAEMEPLPEGSQHKYDTLRERAQRVAVEMHQFKDQLAKLERDIERAERSNQVGELIRSGSALLQRKELVTTQPGWPETFADECEAILTPVKRMISERIDLWIKAQSCNSFAQVSEFRGRIEKAVRSLSALGFGNASKTLDRRAMENIHEVEKRQKFHLTLDESAEYPHLPLPTDSTLAREMRDDIAKGDRLIVAVKEAAQAISEEEIRNRVEAIEGRQAKIWTCIAKQEQALSDLYSLELRHESSVREALANAYRLRDIFIGTLNAEDVGGLIIQLQRVLSDLAAWPEMNVPVERLDHLIAKTIEKQIALFAQFLDENELDPAWPLESVYKDLAAERVETASRHSSSWLESRMLAPDAVKVMTMSECERLGRELAEPPSFLADRDRAVLDEVRERVEQRIEEMRELERVRSVKKWQSAFTQIEGVETLSKEDIEDLLNLHQTPPVALRSGERGVVAEIVKQLTLRLDSMSIDEILKRIKFLPTDAKRRLRDEINQLLDVENG
jgi:hypothetical protein